VQSHNYCDQRFDQVGTWRECNASTATSTAIAQQTAKGIPDVENVDEDMAQRNVSVGHFNAYTARIHMKHGAMSVLHRSLRSIGSLEERQDHSLDLFTA
jgi:hypothetical protein